MKNTKKVLLRIYSRHDLDLVALRNIKEFDINRAIKYVLHEYIKGTPVKMQIPIVPDFTEAKFKSSYTIFLNLNEEEDSDIISFLDTIKPYYRNAAIKTIFRASLLSLPLSVFNKTNSVFTNDYINALNKSIEDEVSSLTFYKPALKKKRYSSKQNNKKEKSFKSKNAKNDILVNNDKMSNIIDEIESVNPINKSSTIEANDLHTNVINTNIVNTFDNTNISQNASEYHNIANIAENINQNPLEKNKSVKVSYTDISILNENNVTSLNTKEDVLSSNNAISTNIDDTSDNDNLDDVDMDFMNAFSSMLTQGW